MQKHRNNHHENKIETETITFPVQLALGEIKENIFNINNPSKYSKEEIINQAFKLHSEGNILEATKYYKYFIAQGFTDAGVFSNYGVILKQSGAIYEAIDLYRKSIKLFPNRPEAYYNLGIILKDLDKLEEAKETTCKAIEINRDYAKAHLNLGCILKDLGKLKEAERSTRKAIELNPKLSQAHYNLGSILLDCERNKEAELATYEAISLNPNYAQAYNNLGIIMSMNKKQKEAKLLFRKAIKLNPNYAEAHNNLGNIMRNLDNLKEAEILTRKAIEIKKDYSLAYFNLSLIELLKGDYKTGLDHYEFRFEKLKLSSPYGSPILNRHKGTPLQENEKLLVISEQAPGDVIFHMRYLLPLKKQGVDVSFCAPKKLHSLIKDSGIHPNPLSPEECTLVTEGEWIPLLSLLKYFKVSPNNPVINTPYLSTTETLKDKWRKILSNEKRPIIGINWQGSKKLDETFYKGRSIPLEKFSKLLEKNDIRFLSFQKGFGSEQMEECTFKDHFVSCQKQIDEIWDYSETAAIIEGCDLIITNDCSIGPLAAGMGKKVWLMLKKIPFWTWGLEGESTFWYPSMRLFRQKELDNWDEVMERVSIELKGEISERG